uniref:Peptidase M13 C-terminal domain-containing protein n=1 Tax=Romanomermis culicivorax TaxID=13658 RepID=A0A915KBR9_ROMCU
MKSSDTYSDMLTAVNTFNRKNTLNMLSKPPDKSLLVDPLFTLGAILITQNTAIIPIGLLQPMLYSRQFPKAYNFGSVGGQIAAGYLLLLGQKGSFYDKIGNRARWWSASTIKNYETKRQCISQWYKSWAGNIDKSESVKDLIWKVDSSHDIYAFRAYKSSMSKVGQRRSTLPGLNLTDEQLFFVAGAQ